MKRLSAIFILGFFLSVHTVFAIGDAPTEPVWVVPAGARAGENIRLNAFIFNSTQTDIKVTVEFATSEKTVGTEVVLIPAQTAKLSKVSWRMPDEPQNVVVTIVKAVTTAEKPVPEMVGTIGHVSLNVSQPNEISATDAALFARLKSFAFVQEIELFRIKKATYFTQLRDTTKGRLNISVDTEALWSKPDVPGVPGETKEQTIQELQTPIHINVGEYATLIYATAFSTLFGVAIVFYVTGVLLCFLILRFIFGRLF